MKQIAVLAVLTALLTGCGAQGAGGISGVWVDYPDDRMVWCAATGVGSLDCNWHDIRKK